MHAPAQDYACSSSPYLLSVSTQDRGDGNSTVTLGVAPNPSANAQSPCYSTLSSTLQRVALLTGQCGMQRLARAMHANTVGRGQAGPTCIHMGSTMDAVSVCMGHTSACMLGGVFARTCLQGLMACLNTRMATRPPRSCLILIKTLQMRTG